MNHITDLAKCFAKDPSVVSRKIADEFILVPLHPKAGEIDSIYTMNDVAATIWELIDGKRQVEDIKETLLEEFDVNAEEAERDLVEFIQHLESIGAVREV
jgi:hypothetical protein